LVAGAGFARTSPACHFRGSTAAWPLVARAQQPTVPVIGFVEGGSADAGADLVRAFRKVLGETGYVEGQNVAIEYRWAENQLDRLLQPISSAAA
jgi:putative tryptophan/tyrosine transport system substrate-binding protein